MIPVRILIILLAVLLFSCSENPRSTGSLIVGRDSVESLPADTNPPVTITPVNATRQTTIYLTSDNSLTNGGIISWYINGSKVKSETGISFNPDELNKGDVVQAVVVNSGEEFRSNEITIKNTPPVMLDVRLLPEAPKVGSIFQVSLKSNDVDSDTLSYKYEWTLNGLFAGEEDYLETDLKRGDEIAVTVTPYDGEDFGRPVKLTSTVRNSLPVFTDSSPSFTGDTYAYQLTATDPDGDRLEYSLIESPQGMTIDSSSGLITWKVGMENEGIHDIKASIKDNNGGELIIPFTTRISFAKNER